MRAARRQRKDAFARLKGLPFYDVLEDRLRSGWPISALATWVMATGAVSDIDEASLRRTLYRFRRSLVPNDDERRKLLDELRELVVLYRRQVERIEIDRDLEKALGKLTLTVGSDIRVAGEVLARIAHIKVRLGLYRPARGEHPQ